MRTLSASTCAHEADWHSLPRCASVLEDVLVCPTRPVPRLKDLNTDELAALMGSVQRVGNVIEKAYGADALTVACQVRFHVSLQEC